MTTKTTLYKEPLSKFSNGILETVGNTPLVKLNNLQFRDSLKVFAKLESFNPGGSIKDRPALNILKEALTKETINKSTTIIESSSGNMGIGLAQACTYLGLKFICVVDAKTTKKNLEILKILGAEVEVIDKPDPATGEYLQPRINRVEELLKEIPNSFWTNQYSNIDNANAHHKTVGEILESLDNKVDYLFCATSSCGTIRGCAEYVRIHSPQTKIIGVDAVGSTIFGHKPQKRIIPGHGSSIIPPLLKAELVDDVVHIKDWDCVSGCYKLVKREAIFAGGSSGGVLSAAELYSEKMEDGSNCVLIFPDRGERYMDTIYSEDWVTEHFGNLPQV